MTNPTKHNDPWVHGYCDETGMFLGYSPTLTLIPGLYPAKFHKETGTIVPTGNLQIIPKGAVLETDAAFIDPRTGGGEKILSGMHEDKGSGLAPTGAVPVNIPLDLQERILEKQLAQIKEMRALEAEQAVGKGEPSSSDANRSEELLAKIRARREAADAQAGIDTKESSDEKQDS